MSNKNHSKNNFDIQFVTASISTTLVLILLGCAILTVLTAQHLSVFMKENFTLSIYLESSAKKTEIYKFQKQLNAKDFVHSTHYISKEDALKEQTKLMGTDPSDFLGTNPFNSTIELHLKSEFANPERVKTIQKNLLENKLVDEVSYSDEVMDLLNNNFKRISFILLLLASMLGLISFALINNMIRLTIYSQRSLIHTMKLVGASWGFIRRPFLIRNFWIGFLSALLANGFLLAAVHTIFSLEPQLKMIITTETILIVVGSIFLFGLLITFLCAYVSISKYLRMKSSTLYYV
ncbi:MAG: permease-like cell division protein FtsX [Bacteroidaceae bacterium]|nr:permease-like cell division protein FtsX [Bacteroidaceae bacterium]